MQEKTLDILFVVNELPDFEALSETFSIILSAGQIYSRIGHNVTFAFIPTDQTSGGDEAKFKAVSDYLFQNFLIRFEFINHSNDIQPFTGYPEKSSYVALDFISKNQFDCIVFMLEGGLAYYPLLAKETLVLPAEIQIAVIATTPLEWESKSKKFFLENVMQVTIAHMERYSIEHANHLLLSSTYMKNWLGKAGINSKGKVHVLPPILPFDSQVSATENDFYPEFITPSEIVIFAEHDTPGAISLVCDMLDKSQFGLDPNFTVCLFGPFKKFLGEHTGGLLLRRGRKWQCQIKLFSGKSLRQKLIYCQEQKAAAVITGEAIANGSKLLACKLAAIKCLAIDAGAISELAKLLGCQRDVFGCNPSSLAEAMSKIHEQEAATASLTVYRGFEQTWVKVLKQLAINVKNPDKHTAKKKLTEPLVTIVMAHFERPQYLLQAIHAIENQTYKNIELIVVDDGSTTPAALVTLTKLEEKFASRNWKLVRQKNLHLGAARNRGIKLAKGSFIMFADDDNALFSDAVAKFVRSIVASDADICTAFHKVFFEDYVPADNKRGMIHYLALGGSLDLAFIKDSYGDANAIFKREVFDKIGLLVEDYGFTAHDWEFFTRAALNDLKVRLIPEALYWYRSKPNSMYRTSHWYDNRQPIIETFRKHNLKGLDHLLHLVMANHVDPFEQNGMLENLRHEERNRFLLTLCSLEPNSQAALNQLANIAAKEGRPGTAIILLADNENNLVEGGKLTHDFNDEYSTAKRTASSGFFWIEKLNANTLRRFSQIDDNGGSEEPTRFYLEKNDQLIFEARSDQTAIIALAAGCVVGTIELSIDAVCGDLESALMEVAVKLTDVHSDATTEIYSIGDNVLPNCSGWQRIVGKNEISRITVLLDTPLENPANIVVALRSRSKADKRNAVVAIGNIQIKQVVGHRVLRTPRLGPTATQQKSRMITQDALEKSKLVLEQKSDLPLLLVDKKRGGLFLRPSKHGPVFACIPEVFPAFAKKIVASIEIAHDEAGPFEFAMALSRPDNVIDWRKDINSQVIAWSGWKRIDKTFTLEEISVQLMHVCKAHLTVNVGIRLPKGSNVLPSNAFWRQFLISWQS